MLERYGVSPEEQAEADAFSKANANHNEPQDLAADTGSVQRKEKATPQGDDADRSETPSASSSSTRTEPVSLPTVVVSPMQPADSQPPAITTGLAPAQATLGKELRRIALEAEDRLEEMPEKRGTRPHLIIGLSADRLTPPTDPAQTPTNSGRRISAILTPATPQEVEPEMQRKTRAKRARETRRSTQVIH